MLFTTSLQRLLTNLNVIVPSKKYSKYEFWVYMGAQTITRVLSYTIFNPCIRKHVAWDEYSIFQILMHHSYYTEYQGVNMAAPYEHEQTLVVSYKVTPPNNLQ